MGVHVMIQDDESAVSVLMLVIYHHDAVLTRHACILDREETRCTARTLLRLHVHASVANWPVFSQFNCQTLSDLRKALIATPDCYRGKPVLS
jgi:hypothetical protein